MNAQELKLCKEAVEWLRDARSVIARRDLVDASDSVNLAERALLRIPAVKRAMQADGSASAGRLGEKDGTQQE